MTTNVKRLLVFLAWCISLGLVWMGASSGEEKIPDKPDCAQLWEWYGEDVGAACFDSEHLKEKVNQ
jgi:hypothetical protein